MVPQANPAVKQRSPFDRKSNRPQDKPVQPDGGLDRNRGLTPAGFPSSVPPAPPVWGGIRSMPQCRLHRPPWPYKYSQQKPIWRFGVIRGDYSSPETPLVVSCDPVTGAN